MACQMPFKLILLVTSLINRGAILLVLSFEWTQRKLISDAFISFPFITSLKGIPLMNPTSFLLFDTLSPTIQSLTALGGVSAHLINLASYLNLNDFPESST